MPQFDSLILLEETSNHMPTLTMMRQTKLRDKTPLEFELRNINDNKLSMIWEDLKSIDWNGLLRSDDCNENFEQFHSTVMNSMNMIAPLRNVRISWKWKFTELWMDKSIEKVSNKCKQLYKKSIDANASEEDKVNYTRYRNTYNTLKRNSRMQYYSDKCLAHKNNTKKLWVLMNTRGTLSHI